MQPRRNLLPALPQTEATAGGIVEYSPSSPTAGNLRGICPTCHRAIHRRVNRAKLSVVTRDLEVTLAAPAPRLLETAISP